MVTFQGKQFETWADARASLIAPEPDRALFAGEAVAEEPEVTPAAPPTPSPGKRRESLTDRYRPKRLAELAGQSDAAAVLSAFAADPYPTAFILAGESGTGKTSAAWALAAELGCDTSVSPPEWGGIHSIPSGDLNADSLRQLWPSLWTRPFSSVRGWKVLICNEVEQLNGTVEKLFLDKLEDIPPDTVVIFTTNNLASLPSRFVDRCIGGVLEFRASADDLADPARALARSIWLAETGAEMPADALDAVISKSTQAGRLSFRRVVQQLNLLLAKGKR